MLYIFVCWLGWCDKLSENDGKPWLPRVGGCPKRTEKVKVTLGLQPHEHLLSASFAWIGLVVSESLVCTTLHITVLFNGWLPNLSA